MNPFNNLSPAEAERLALLAEECAEVIQIVGKIMRHGYESHHPDSPTVTNRALLQKEIGDVQHVTHMMFAAGDIRRDAVTEAAWHKGASIKRWLHHQGDGR